MSMTLEELKRTPCIVCGRPPVCMGLFAPNAKWQAERAIKAPTIPYTVCERHANANDPLVLEVVEQAIDRKYGVGVN
jgi:hypothetical protein